MNAIKTIFYKELRSYFLSPVALVFLGIFLMVNLFVFFTYATFFARNIADVRPMFEWLPILLVFLVAVISMRSWSEEQAQGTLEVLMTMPIRTSELVLGKLAAGMALVGTALLLTLPLPIMVSVMGNLDMGPVVGGYVGALFLALAYLSIGMCVSARTTNQIVALMVTALVGGFLYLLGTDTLTGFLPQNVAHLLRELGSGSRFYNIERGVLDLRDVAYYGSLAAFFVALNIHFINAKRADAHSSEGRRRVLGQRFQIWLLGANLLALNIWLAPISTARADLTAEGQFSISDATVHILDGLNEPLVIAGYFSDITHPLLAPLVPRIRDFLVEYKNAGHGRVTVKFENPNKDEKLEQEVAEAYNIRPLPFRVAARHQQSVVNAYFHILVKYGDQYAVLSIDDLIDVDQNGSDVEVRLKNLEYDITRTIKKVSSGFQSIESVFASMPQKANLKFFVTPKTLPEDMAKVPEQVKKVAADLEKKSGGKFIYEEVNLDGQPGKQQEVADKYGLRPMATDLFAENTFFLHMLLTIGKQEQRIVLQGKPTEAAIRTAIEGAFKRATPGFIKTIGLLTAKPDVPPQNPNLPPQMQPPVPKADYQVLEKHLSQEFKVERVELDDGVVPGNIDVLLVGKTGALSDKQKFAVDQYLMNGGAVIALAGDRKIQASQQGINAVATDPGLKEMLKTWGVEVEPGFVMDTQNASFPVPIQEQHGMFMVRKIKMMEYPLFPDIRSDGFNQNHIATAGLQNVVFNWGSAIKLKKQKGVKAQQLLHTSAGGWTEDSTKVLPTSFDSAQSEFAPPSSTSTKLLAATLEGDFDSYFADKDSPLFTDKASSTNSADKEGDQKTSAKADRTGRTLKKGHNGRLAVVASSELLSDLTAQVGDQISGNVYASNFQFARNLIDWATAETDLLDIRTSGTFARTLNPMEESVRTTWEVAQYVFVVLALLGVAFVAIIRRRSSKSIVEGEVAK